MTEQPVAEGVDARTQALDLLLEHLAIRDALTRYCRAADRIDPDLARTVFHLDATIDYPGMCTGTREEFFAWIFESHVGYQSTSHQVTNTTIKIHGDTAVSEAYVLARLRGRPDASGRRVDMVVTGRYLDRWTKRDSGWMIDERVFMNDGLSDYELATRFDTDQHPGRPDQAEHTLTRRDRGDPSYALLDSIG